MKSKACLLFIHIKGILYLQANRINVCFLLLQATCMGYIKNYIE